MKLADMKLKTKMALGSCISLALLVVLGTVTFFSNRTLLDSGRMVNHTHVVIEEAMSVLASAVDMETGMRGYLLAGKESFLEPYHNGYEGFMKRVGELKEEVSDNPAQVTLLAEMVENIQGWRKDVTEPTIELRRRIGNAWTMDDMADMVGEARGKVFFDRFRGKIAEFIQREEELMNARRAVSEEKAVKGAETVKTLGENSKWVAHTHDVMGHARDILAAAVDMETGMRGFLLAGKEQFLDPYNEGQDRFEKLVAETMVLVGDNPAQRALLDGIAKSCEQWRVEVAEPAVKLRRVVGNGNTMDDVAALVGEEKGKKYFDRLRRQIGAFVQREEHLLVMRETAAREASNELVVTLDALVEASEMVNHTHGVIEGAMKIEAAAVDMETGMRGYLLAGKKEFLGPYRNGEKRFFERLEKLSTAVSDNPAQVTLLGDMGKTIKEWQEEVTESAIALRTEIGDAKTMNDMAKLVAEARGKVYFDKFRKQVETFIGREQALMDERHKRAGATADTAKLTIVLGTLVIIVISLFVSLLLANIISRAVNRAVELADALAEGDMTRRLDVKTKDEVGALSSALNRIAEGLGKMLGEVRGSSDVLSESSRNLSAVSTELVQGADETLAQSSTVADASTDLDGKMGSVAATMEQAATNINMMATATEEMTSTIAEIADNAEKARGISDSAVAQARDTSDRMKDLGTAAKDISMVTDTIAGISEQTNLLALNATIEAARAGDAGKGFAVVAGEIKELARQTASATDEIKEKVDGIQSSTEAGIGRIDEICGIIGDVNEIIVMIAGAIGEQSATTGEIAANVGQTSQGIQEVNENVALSSTLAGDISGSIATVNGAAESMSGSSTDVNRHAEELSELSAKLTEMVGRFKL